MNPMQPNLRSVPPKEARHFCYRVYQELAKKSPRLDVLYLPLKTVALETTRQELLNVLVESPVWEKDLPGLIPTSSERGAREVEIELLDVATAMLGKGHKAVYLWNSILSLVESGVLVPEISKIRYSLTPSAKRATGLEVNEVVDSSGRVMLRTNFEKCHRFLREQNREAEGHSTVASVRKQQVPDKSILPELRTRRMTLGEAGHLMMGYKGPKKSITKRMRIFLNDGETDYIRINRQSYIFNADDFPPETQGKLK